MKIYKNILASSSQHYIISFRDYIESQYGSEFDPSGLSDDEFYELEDAYRRDVPSEQRELNYR